jgi:hypothetical protein
VLKKYGDIMLYDRRRNLMENEILIGSCHFAKSKSDWQFWTTCEKDTGSDVVKLSDLREKAN